MNPGKLLPSHPGLRRGLPARRAPAARRHLDLSVAVSAVAVHEALADIAGREHCLREAPRAGPLRRRRADPLAGGAPRERRRGEPGGRALRGGAAGDGAARGRHEHRRSAIRPAGSTWCSSSAGCARCASTCRRTWWRRWRRARRSTQLAAHFGPHRQALTLDPPGGGARSVGGVLATARQRAAPLPLRHRPRPPAGRPLRPGRRHGHLGRRQGRQVGDGLRRAEAPGRLARHPRRARRGDAAPAPDAARLALLAAGLSLA